MRREEGLRTGHGSRMGEKGNRESKYAFLLSVTIVQRR